MVKLFDRSRWLSPRGVLFFLGGLGLFLLVQSMGGEEGVRTGRIAAIAILGIVFIGLIAVHLAGRRRSEGGTASDIARLLRAGKVDEAVRAGRGLFEKEPSDPHVAWFYTAALMKSGHVAEARRVFAGLQPDDLPPKMAAMYGEVRRALDGRTAR